MKVEQAIKNLLDDQSIYIVETLQSLWSGYGKILRVSSKRTNVTYIVKFITLNQQQHHPRGWNTSTGHQRKLKSYQVEAAFYQTLAEQTDNNCKAPQLICYESNEDFTLVVLEDLDEQGYFIRQTEGNWQTLSLAIKWLAYFHANFLQQSSNDIWNKGSYWHLDTRHDEYSAMPDSEYKRNAIKLNDALTNANYKTIIHGDAKFENLCFHHDGQHVAAVDFQYAGMGTGAIDLAYLVGSCLNDEQLYHYDDKVIDEYLIQFRQAINHYNKQINFDEFEQEFRRLYPIAWADFYRFLLGWNPDSWKNGQFIKDKSAVGLKQV